MQNVATGDSRLKIEYVPLAALVPAEYNPRKWSEETTSQLKESITRHGIVDPIIVNSAESRKNVMIGGNFRAKVLKDLGYETAPVIYLNIPDIAKEKELNIRLNKNQGEWDLDLLSAFDETLLADIGFSSEELIEELFKVIDKVSINELGMRMKLEEEIKRFNRLQRLATKGTPKYNINEDDVNTREYAKYVLREGTPLEKRELMGHLRSRLLLKDKKITLLDQ
jgi:ParB-like chromosome segregation protein Spo0J